MIFDTLLNLFSSGSLQSDGRGTFGGAPFLIIDDATITGGRRVVQHEYPLRDDSETEDMGLVLRKYSLTFVVLGANYVAERDALIDALEKGEGELEHPYYKTQNVQIEEYTVRESTTRGGIAMFSVTAYPATQETAPMVETAKGIETTSIMDALIADAAVAFNVAKSTVRDISQLVDTISNSINVITNGIRNFSSTLGLPSLLASSLSLQGAVKHLINSPDILFSELGHLIKAITSSPNKPKAYTVLNTIALQLNHPPQTSINNGITHLSGIVNLSIKTMVSCELSKLLVDSAIESTQPSHRSATLTLINQSTRLGSTSLAPSNASNDYAYSTASIPPIIETREDIQRTSSKASEQLIELIFETNERRFSSTSFALRSYRINFMSQMKQLAQSLPKSRVITTHSSEPALVLLYRETADVKQLNRFVRRNGIRHPNFIVGRSEIEVIDAKR